MAARKSKTTKAPPPDNDPRVIKGGSFCNVITRVFTITEVNRWGNSEPRLLHPAQTYDHLGFRCYLTHFREVG